MGKASALPVVEIVGWDSHLDAAWKARPRQSTCNTWANITCMSAMTGADRPLDRGEQDLSLDARVRDLEAVMDALNLRKAALFGDSAGGATAIAYTARHPERVSRLALYGSFLHWAQSPEEVQ